MDERRREARLKQLRTHAGLDWTFGKAIRKSPSISVSVCVAGVRDARTRPAAIYVLQKCKRVKQLPELDFELLHYTIQLLIGNMAVRWHCA